MKMKIKNKKQAFLQAYALVKNPNTFNQGAYAEDANGDIVSYEDESAVRWCSIGAIFKTVEDTSPQFYDIYNELTKFVPAKYDGDIAEMNDTSRRTTLKAWKALGKSKGWL